jgi:glutaredoxin
MTKNILNQNHVEFEYYNIEDLNIEEQKKYFKIAEDIGQLLFPLMFKDESLISLSEAKNVF